MQTLVQTALRFRVIVVALAIGCMIAGILAFRDAPQDVFPEFAPPRVEVQTEAPGLSALEVEQRVTTPLEQALAGLPWVDEIRSKSVLGLSSVVLHLHRDADLLIARQLVTERVAQQARSLPSVARPPVILPPLSTTSRLLKIGLRSETLSIPELSDLALWQVRPRLMALPGVANVAVWGARPRQLQVRVDPATLDLAGVTLAQVTDATRAAVSLQTGGFVDTPTQRMAVFHDPAVQRAEQLAAAPLRTPDGRILRLGDVATVAEGSPPPIGDAVIADGDGLLLIVEKQPWGNTLQVTHAVEEALVDLRAEHPDVVLDDTIFRPATFVETALHNLGHALLLGVLLVVAVLLLFETDPRAALISATAIPLSIATALLVLRALGTTFDTMVLAGLVIAVGEVVDDAIIDVENIARRLREPGARRLDTVLAASLEVRSAVVYASIIVVLVFVPVFFLDGVSGAFFRPLALSYIVAISASLLVALTVTPSLCLWFLPARSERPAPRANRAAKAIYRRVLPVALRHPRTLAAGLLTISVLTAASVPWLGESFLPDFQEDDFLMHWVEQPGTSLVAMRRVTERAAAELTAIPGVTSFGAHIGRAEAADEVVGPNFTELWIHLDPAADREAALARVHEVVQGYPGLYRDVLTYLRERIKEVLSGTSATLVVRIEGPDLDELHRVAEQVRGAMSGVDGITPPRVEVVAQVPQVHVQPRAANAAVLGLAPGDVRAATTALLAGTVVGSVPAGLQSIDVAVLGDDDLRASPSALTELWIPTPGGGRVRLGDVADVWVASAPNVIQHEGGSRRLDVLADASSGDLGAVARGVQQAVARLDLPAGYRARVLGEFQEREQATSRLRGLTLAALFAIFLVLHADFQNVSLAGLVYATLPFALIGGVVGVWLTGGVLSLGSVVGFVTILGIATRNGILLVSHYRHLEEEAPTIDLDQLRTRVLQASEERLVPILMTAASAGLALVPILASGPVAGHEIEHPMAVVIVGGLVSSTALNLLCLPAFYLAWRAPRLPLRA
ncbi:MAG: efflux RND transporter permease subunit [Alphaproteobacteria bacterium]|nr:efflux RND transporter permease subunit [Alphaproteobacteria bacterium]